MPDYKKYDCPVCNRTFEENDDIVTCPICGTPHHRECYNITGHCVNKGLHSTGYSFKDDYKASAEKDEESEDIVEQAKKERLMNMLTESDDQQGEYISSVIEEYTKTDYDDKNEKIDKYYIGDIAATVRNKSERFIGIFKKLDEKNKKIHWNWGGFLFGSLYLFYRKMYKQGIAFFSIFISAIFVSNAMTIRLAPEYLKGFTDFLKTYIGNSQATQQEITKALNDIMSLPDYKTAITISYVTYGVIIALRIIIGLFSDYFYKNYVFHIIDRVSEQLENGASFTQTPVFMPQQKQLTQLQMKRMYLANRGGVTLFAPLIAVSLFYTIINLIQ